MDFTFAGEENKSDIKVPQWDHVSDIEITRPSIMSTAPKGVNMEETCVIEYDGGYQSKQGTAGYIAFGPD